MHHFRFSRVTTNELPYRLTCKFGHSSSEILDESENRARNVFGMVQTMSKVSTSMALNMNRSWPFVTLPHFESWAGGLNLELTGADNITFGVLVAEDERLAWNNYSSTHAEDWILESLKVSDGAYIVNDTVISPTDYTPVTPYIWNYDEKLNKFPDNVAVEYAVTWQNTPAVPEEVNRNNLAAPSFYRLLNQMKHDRNVVLSGIVKDDDRNVRMSFLLQPIFEDLGNFSSKIVGFLKVETSWDFFLQDMLPKGTEGVHVVVWNSCDQGVTYDLNGPLANYLGEGDLHDPSYDYMVISREFDPLGIPTQDSASETVGCSYELRLYPSRAFEKQFQSNRPIIYAAVGVIVFMFTALAFLMYDWFVRRRQHRMVTTAERSNAIVNSLFPANVRDRLLEEGTPVKEDEPTILKPFRSKLVGAYSASTSSQPLTRVTKPIADLFPAATILFADIVGFTAWSSVREPSQVFTLLETLYDAFDQIAKRQNVFKVETIGDCYVAVAGLPTPRKDHALVMAKFARECLSTMINLFQSLETILGPETGKST